MRGERGSGLLLVLMIVVIAGFLVAAMVMSQATSIRRSALLIAHDRAVELLGGFEAWAGVVLRRDRGRGSTDNRAEDWARELAPVKTDSGTISGRIIDMQGRVNVNNLVLGNDALKKLTRERLLRLFDICGVEPLALVALEDWLDSDDEVRPMGAEADYYQEQGSLARPANRAVYDLSGLAYLRYMEPEGYSCLRGNISALPAATPVNVNTAGPRVLASLAAGVDVDAVDGMVPDDGFASMTDFLALDVWKDKGLTGAGLVLGSDFFLIRAEAVNGYGAWALESLVDRSHGVAVMRRAFFRGGRIEMKGESS